MNHQSMIMAQRYLYRFDQILNEMAEKMLHSELTNYSITIDFIRCMVPHHQAAIYMSENLLMYTRYQPIRKIADGIIKMQTKGIEQMEEIIKTTSGYMNTERDINTYLTKYFEITNTMIENMKNSPRCININLDFINEMIPHHEGAIKMCNNLIQYYIDPRLRNVADTIIQEQSRGIKELEEIRNNLCKR